MITIILCILCLVVGFLIGYFWVESSVTIRMTEIKSQGEKPLFETTGNVKVIIESNNIKTS
jgi:hypothetical protein